MRRTVSTGLLVLMLGGVACQRELPTLGEVPDFSLIDQHGKPFTRQALRGKVWVAQVIFTHCPAVCPVMTQRLVALQQRFWPLADDLHWLSLSIDPERDTPLRLRVYAAQQDINLRNWTLLTGSPEAVQALAGPGLRLGGLRRVGPGEGGLMHASYFVLVDAQQRLRGFYRNDPARLADLATDIKRLVQQATPRAIWRGRIALLNALLNASAGLLLVAGYLAIRRRQRATHQRLMVSAFVVSCLFLVSYLTRRIAFGDAPYLGIGWQRPLYFAILIPHVLLAIAVVPLALRTLWLGGRAMQEPARVANHRRLAKITLPVWLYVSVTGVVVYLMLYG